MDNLFSLEDYEENLGQENDNKQNEISETKVTQSDK